MSGSTTPPDGYSLEALAALRAALAKGVRRVKYSSAPGVSQEVEYASLSDLRAAIAELETALGVKPPIPRFGVVTPVRPFGRGER